MTKGVTTDSTQRADPDSERGERTGKKRGLVLRGILPGDTRRLPLDGQSLVIGRGEGSALLLDRSDVSRRHVELYRQGPSYALKDLGSMNGTYVNGRRAVHAAVNAGMLLRLGQWLGAVDELEPGEADVEFGELSPGLYGGPLLLRLLKPLERIAPTTLPVVLVGATGTGKERFAHALHHFSRRRGRLHALNCAAMPPELAEAELFGYRRGAFTGAERSHPGHLRAAQGGTLFLDELGELSLPLQAKLLRAIESGVVLPLGEHEPQPFDARIVVASQVPLEELVKHRGFRPDLAARLAGFTLSLPTLFARRSDVPNLFWQFLCEASAGRATGASTGFYERLCLYSWPGNVRELDLLARELSALHPDDTRLQSPELPERIRREVDAHVDVEEPPEPGQQPVAGDRRDHDLQRLREALKATGGNVTRAAAILGLSRQRAYRLMDGKSPEELVRDAS